MRSCRLEVDIGRHSMHLRKSKVCSNELDVQEANCSLTKFVNSTPHPHALSTEHFSRACISWLQCTHRSELFSCALCQKASIVNCAPCFILHCWSSNVHTKQSHFHHDTNQDMIVKIIIGGSRSEHRCAIRVSELLAGEHCWTRQASIRLLSSSSFPLLTDLWRHLVSREEKIIVKIRIPISALQNATGCLVGYSVSRLQVMGPNMTFGLPSPGQAPPNNTSRTTFRSQLRRSEKEVMLARASVTLREKTQHPPHS